MAGFVAVTGAPTTVAHMKSAGVKRLHFTCATAANDSTTIAAAVTGRRHIIVGGRISSTAAETVNILSASTVLTSVALPGAGTISLPFGLETVAGELLALQKTLAGVLVGWIDYVTIDDGGILNFAQGLLHPVLANN